MASPVYLLGDIHGQYEQLVRLLHSAGLIDAQLRWSGGASLLWCVGDFFDRGPDGVAAVDLFMRLQQQAPAAGGRVDALIGNHDLRILAAQRFGELATHGPGGSFVADWLRNGGVLDDLARLTPAHIDWLCKLPALALMGDWLLAHADSTLYLRYGSTIDTVNAAFASVLRGNDPAAFDRLLDDFDQHGAFLAEPRGLQQARHVLATYGGRRLIHGHTPISKMTGLSPSAVVAPFIYAEGLCVNIDGGMYLGGPGFIHHILLP